MTTTKAFRIATGTAARLNVGTGANEIPTNLDVEQFADSKYAIPDDNRIINGDFGIWQRGTSQATDGYGSADRWRNSVVGGTVTMSRQSHTLGDQFGGNTPQFYLRQAVSGHSATVHFSIINQRIESVRTYAGETITVLGWARRSAGTGNMVAEGVQNFGTGGSPSTSVTGISPTTIALTSSWEPFAVVLTVPSITGKTLGSDGNDSFTMLFWTSAGSDFNARTNSLGLQTIDVDLWGVHIRRGTWSASATELYRPRQVAEELALCQRYFQLVTITCTSYATGGTGAAAEARHNFPVPMRATPTAAAGSTGSTAHFNSSSNTLTIANARHAFASATISAVTGGFSTRFIDWQFDAEL
jgi:hypothetical protein